jgi:hypothetical protein
MAAGPALVLAMVAGALPFLAPLAAQEPSSGAAAGTADGWLEVAKERTLLRHAWVFGESGDGASDALRLVIADRELPPEALEDAKLRDELAAGDRARSLVADLPGEGAEIELFLHHPRLPRGVSLRGLAKFVPESVTAARLEGRLILPGPTAVEVWFSAPIERRDRAQTLADAPSPDRPALSLDDAIRDGGEEALDLALEAAVASGSGLDAVSGAGLPPLAIAADAGNLYAVRQLLAAGAAVDFRTDRAAMTALMVAGGRANIEVLEALLAAGANPKLRSSSGFTALMHAVIEGRTENARRLIAAGADVARDRDTLLKLASEKANAEMVLLLESASAAPAAASPPG